MDKEVQEFFAIMSETGRLSAYLPSRFDFEVDPDDPIIDDLVQRINEAGDARKVLESEDYNYMLLRGLERHVTSEIRFRLFETLSALEKQVQPSDSKLLRAALMALEDIKIHPGVIGVIMELYHRQLLNMLLVRADPGIRVSKEVTSQIRKIKKTFSKAELRQLLQNDHDQIVEAIIKELEDDTLSDQAYKNLCKTLLKIPGHLSAGVVCDMLFEFEIDFETIVRQADKRLLESIATRLLHEIGKAGADFFKKWIAYEYLSKIRDFRVLNYLRQELETRQTDEEDDAEIAFYSEVVEMLCDLGDRRAIPTLIDFLYDGSNRGFSESILNEAHSALKQSSWYHEIISGVNLMREGKVVIVRKGEDFLDSAESRLKNLSQVQTLLESGSPDHIDLTETLRHQQTRWNEAYHEGLDGLRPIDIPVSQVKQRLMHQMLEEFESEHSGSSSSIEDVEAQYAEFQNRWLITPNAQGAIPQVMIMKAEEKKAKTQALKDHFQKYKEETLNNYYIEAAADFENGFVEECRLKVNAILQIDSAHRFAKRLKNQLPSKK